MNGKPVLDNGTPRVIPPERMQGYIAGPMAHIPEPWRAALRGDVLSGQTGLPIITRQSAGPCVHSWSSADLLDKAVVPATMLMCFPSSWTALADGTPAHHWMPGHPWSNPNPDDVLNRSTEVKGMTIVGDQIVFLARHGYGVPCYGVGVNDPKLHNVLQTPAGPMQCYDPTSPYNGMHVYPYRTQLYVAPLSLLADIAAGKKKPWETLPSTFPIDVPFHNPGYEVTGLNYDPSTRLLWVGAYKADGAQYEPGPVLHAFEVTGASSSP